MAKITKGEAADILASLRVFRSLERRNTDEIGWIALRYSTTRTRAAKMIEQAQAIAEGS